MYKDGWWLAMRMPRTPWKLEPALLAKFAPGVWDPDADPVELYYLPDDFSQANDLSATHPEKVKELHELFWAALSVKSTGTRVFSSFGVGPRAG